MHGASGFLRRRQQDLNCHRYLRNLFQMQERVCPWERPYRQGFPPSMNTPPSSNPESRAEPVVPGLLAPEIPWRRQFAANVRDLISPAQLPPLELTSTPVAVKDIWGQSAGNERTAGFTSLLVHGGVIASLFLIGTNETVKQIARNAVHLATPDLSEFVLKPQPMQGGGGGGNLSDLDASKGKLPKIAKQFVPPTAVVLNENPKLIMEMSIEVPANAVLPTVALNTPGDPMGLGRIPSNGQGPEAGIGNGRRGGVGPGDGPGVGRGTRGGIGDGAFRIGGGVSAPAVLATVEPEYSEEARRAKFQGTVTLYIEVDEHGKPKNLRVMNSLGLGLDEKALEAVSKWKFKPGRKDGVPVTVAATVEVNFRLL